MTTQRHDSRNSTPWFRDMPHGSSRFRLNHISWFMLKSSTKYLRVNLGVNAIRINMFGNSNNILLDSTRPIGQDFVYNSTYFTSNQVSGHTWSTRLLYISVLAACDYEYWWSAAFPNHRGPCRSLREAMITLRFTNVFVKCFSNCAVGIVQSATYRSKHLHQAVAHSSHWTV